MNEHTPMTDAERIQRLEAEVAALKAERVALVIELRSEIARVAAELERHKATCPGTRATQAPVGPEGL